MKLNKILTLVTLGALCLAGCRPEDPLPVEATYIDIEGESSIEEPSSEHWFDLSVKTDGEDATFIIKTDYEKSPEKGKEWLNAEYAAGSLTISLQANESSENRTATVTISSGKGQAQVTITQLSSVKYATGIKIVSKSVIERGAAAADFSLDVKTDGDASTISASVEYAVETEKDEEWINAEYTDGKLDISLAGNAEGKERIATVTLEAENSFATASVIVKQTKGIVLVSEIELDPVEIKDVPSAGETYEIAVIASGDDLDQITAECSDPSWITAEYDAKTMKLTVTVAANTDKTDRPGSVTVKAAKEGVQAVLPIAQLKYVDTIDGISVSPLVAVFPCWSTDDTEMTKEIKVTAEGDDFSSIEVINPYEWLEAVLDPQTRILTVKADYNNFATDRNASISLKAPDSKETALSVVQKAGWKVTVNSNSPEKETIWYSDSPEELEKNNGVKCNDVLTNINLNPTSPKPETWTDDLNAWSDVEWLHPEIYYRTGSGCSANYVADVNDTEEDRTGHIYIGTVYAEPYVLTVTQLCKQKVTSLEITDEIVLGATHTKYTDLNADKRPAIYLNGELLDGTILWKYEPLTLVSDSDWITDPHFTYSRYNKERRFSFETTFSENQGAGDRTGHLTVRSESGTEDIMTITQWGTGHLESFKLVPAGANEKKFNYAITEFRQKITDIKPESFDPKNIKILSPGTQKDETGKVLDDADRWLTAEIDYETMEVVYKMKKNPNVCNKTATSVFNTFIAEDIVIGESENSPYDDAKEMFTYTKYPKCNYYSAYSNSNYTKLTAPVTNGTFDNGGSSLDFYINYYYGGSYEDLAFDNVPEWVTYSMDPATGILKLTAAPNTTGSSRSASIRVHHTKYTGSSFNMKIDLSVSQN